MKKQQLADFLVSEGKVNTKVYKELGVKGKKVENPSLKDFNFMDLDESQLKSMKRMEFKSGNYSKAIENALTAKKSKGVTQAASPKVAKRPTEPK